jgi:WD40 repeat protein
VDGQRTVVSEQQFMKQKKSEFTIIDDLQSSGLSKRKRKPRIWISPAIRYIGLGMVIGMTVIIGIVALLNRPDNKVVPQISETATDVPSVSPVAPLDSSSLLPTETIREIESIAISPRGDSLAIVLFGSDRWRLQLRSLTGSDLSKSDVKSWSSLNPGVLDVEFSGNGQFLMLSGGMRMGWHSTELWDSLTVVPRFDLDGGTAAFSPDSKLLATGSRKGAINLWDVETGTLQDTVYHPAGSVFDIAFSPDGTKLAATSYRVPDNGGLSVWDVRDINAVPMTMPLLSDVMPSLAFHPDSSRIAILVRGGVQMIDFTRNSFDAWKQGGGSTPSDLSFSPDGKWLAISYWGVYSSPLTGNLYGAISLWSVQNKAEELILNPHKNYTSSIAFTPDGKYLLSAGSENTVYLWDYIQGIELSHLTL